MYDFKALYEASSVRNAIELLDAHPSAKIIAGGSDMLIKLREGHFSDCELVSIYTLDELRGVELLPDGTLKILPLTSFSHVTRDPLIIKHIPVLGEAADTAGGPQLRNIGTIGGNVSNGVTSADTASTLLAYDAVVELTGKNGVRVLPLKDYYISPGKVALEPAEILTAILIKKESYEGYFGHYIKYAMRDAMDIATLGCSVNVKLSPDRQKIEDMRVGFGVAGPVPMRAPSAEALAKGMEVSLASAEEISKATVKDTNPRTSWRATKEFRTQLTRELAKRALIKCIALAGGKI